MDNFEKTNYSLYKVLKREVPEQCRDVFNQNRCDIEASFLGFVETYYYLSLLIPRHFTILDLGCAYAPQAYYFKDHKQYVGIDTLNTRFSFQNTRHIFSSIEDYIESWRNVSTEEIFAICNYVPLKDTLNIRSIFQNLYIYYPCGSIKQMIMLK